MNRKNDCQWGCLETGGCWALGCITDRCIENPVASVKRQKNGSWDWRILSDPLSFFGNEPSRDEAMKAAEKHLCMNETDRHIEKLVKPLADEFWEHRGKRDIEYLLYRAYRMGMEHKKEKENEEI